MNKGVEPERTRGPPASLSARYDALLRAMNEGLLRVDGDGRITEINATAERCTEWPAAEAVGRPHDEVLRLVNGSGEEVVSPLWECAQLRAEVRRDQPGQLLVTRSGRRLAVSCVALPDEPGSVLLFQDITERTLLSQELSFRSQYDLITGAVNREEFEQRLRAAVNDAQNHDTRHLLLYVDVDHFRVINDTLGHQAGDELLRDVAAILRARLRQTDVLARLGGDEFGVLLHGCDPASGRSMVEAMLQGARTYRFQWEERSHGVTLSIGAAVITSQIESVARLMSDADAACRAAKEAGRDRARFADADVARRYGELNMVARISAAVDQDRFVLHSEDVVLVGEPNRVVYRELLVRLTDDDGRLLFPSTFVPIAERYFLVTSLDRWVVSHALRWLAARPHDGIVYAINLSGQSLSDENFHTYVMKELEKSGVAPSRVCFEITETAAVSRLTEAVRFITRLSETGVRFSLDDFGAGMASFSYLKNLPVHYVKIDGSFVQAMHRSKVDRGMVEAINRIGHEMGLQTIAEQVEDRAVLEHLAAIGVNLAQGRAIAEGRPLDGF